MLAQARSPSSLSPLTDGRPTDLQPQTVLLAPASKSQCIYSRHCTEKCVLWNKGWAKILKGKEKKKALHVQEIPNKICFCCQADFLTSSASTIRSLWRIGGNRVWKTARRHQARDVIKERCDFTARRRSDCEKGLKINRKKIQSYVCQTNWTWFMANCEKYYL